MYDEINDSKTVYHQGDLLAVTIAPDDKVQGYLGKERYSNFVKYYSTKFERLSDPKEYDYWFRIELSEPIGEVKSEGPRLHLHGLVRLKTKNAVFKWLYMIMPDLLQHAILNIKHCSEDRVSGWLAYCNKQNEYIPKPGYLSNHVSPCGEELAPRSAELAKLPSPAGAGEREGGKCGAIDPMV